MFKLFKRRKAHYNVIVVTDWGGQTFARQLCSTTNATVGYVEFTKACDKLRVRNVNDLTPHLGREWVYIYKGTETELGRMLEGVRVA